MALRMAVATNESDRTSVVLSNIDEAAGKIKALK
jgi:hypothetical protein